MDHRSSLEVTLDDLGETVNLDPKQWGTSCAFTILYHPLDYCKTLIQIGYEPFPPTDSRFFHSHYLGLPNLFQYLRYVKSVDGFWGCYRGLAPKLCGNTVQAIVYNTLTKKVAEHEQRRSGKTTTYTAAPERDVTVMGGALESDPTIAKLAVVRSSAWVRAGIDAEMDVKTFLRKTGLEILCVTGSTIAAHPLHVICVRTMAQFVGRESVYTSISQSIAEIYAREGIRGFFSGLAPRLVADVVYLSVSAAIVYGTLKQLGNSPLTQQTAGMAANMIGGSLSYPFHVVTNTMIVNDSGLAIGTSPYTRIYVDWTDAYQELKRLRQLKRGASIIGRAYTGPATGVKGALVPYGFHFGPAHAPGTSYSAHYLNLSY